MTVFDYEGVMPYAEFASKLIHYLCDPPRIGYAIQRSGIVISTCEPHLKAFGYDLSSPWTKSAIARAETELRANLPYLELIPTSSDPAIPEISTKFVDRGVVSTPASAGITCISLFGRGF